jgi:hypothetical protein
MFSVMSIGIEKSRRIISGVGTVFFGCASLRSE